MNPPAISTHKRDARFSISSAICTSAAIRSSWSRMKMMSLGRPSGSCTSGTARFTFKGCRSPYEMDSLALDVDPVVERRLLAISLSILTVLAAATAAAETMPLSQIQKGMRGYGVTVFEGDRLAKIEVEGRRVLRNN